jgi:hypothetical protein
LNGQPNEKLIYLYGRLSNEDELAGDSNSIIKEILTLGIHIYRNQ